MSHRPRHVVFTYGTLRQGFIPNEATDRFHAGSRFLARARLAGSLYRVSWYPGLVEGPSCKEVQESHETVVGEIWGFDDDAMLAHLDAYEGIVGDETPEYVRVRRMVQTDEGVCEAWVYVFTAPVEAETRVPSGDWADCVAEGLCQPAAMGARMRSVA